jgi:hypothetical protein
MRDVSQADGGLQIPLEAFTSRGPVQLKLDAQRSRGLKSGDASGGGSRYAAPV